MSYYVRRHSSVAVWVSEWVVYRRFNVTVVMATCHLHRRHYSRRQRGDATPAQCRILISTHCCSCQSATPTLYLRRSSCAVLHFSEPASKLERYRDDDRNRACRLSAVAKQNGIGYVGYMRSTFTHDFVNFRWPVDQCFSVLRVDIKQNFTLNSVFSDLISLCDSPDNIIWKWSCQKKQKKTCSFFNVFSRTCVSIQLTEVTRN